MKLFPVLVGLVLSGCATSEDPTDSEANQRPSIEWKETMVRGATFTSVPDHGILHLRFPKTGNHVSATIGDRKGVLAGPVWFWKIDPSGALVFSDHTGDQTATFELLEYADSAVTVRARDKAIHYHRKKD